MLYTFLKKHVWDGHRGMSIPMIPIGGAKYLPSFYLGLSPFGYEYYWENNFLTENYLSSLYFRLGSGPFADTWGLGFDIDQVGGASELGRPRLGLHVDFWKQPRPEAEEPWSEENQSGICFYAKANMPVHDFSFALLGVAGHVGYKTRGFVMGEEIGKTPIFRLGLSFNLSSR